VHVVYGPIEVSATGLPIVPKDPTKRDVSECDVLILNDIEGCRTLGKNGGYLVFPFIKKNLKIWFNMDVVNGLLLRRMAETTPYAWFT
jgi:hypothetical protein